MFSWLFCAFSTSKGSIIAMKVLYILPAVYGADWAVAAVQRLREAGTELTVVLPREQGGLSRRLEEMRLTVISEQLSFSLARPWEINRRARAAAELAERERPNIIHCHSMADAMLLRWANRRGQGPPRIFQTARPPWLESALYRRLELPLSDSRDFWAGSSPEVCGYYTQKGILENRVFLCPYGGEYKRPSSRRQTAAGIRERLGISPEQPLIALDATGAPVGEQAAMQSRFIRAISHVLERLPRVRAVILTREDEPERIALRLMTLARSLCGEALCFSPAAESLTEAYREANLAVHPAIDQNGAGAAMWLAAGVPTLSGGDGERRFGEELLLADRLIYQLENPKAVVRRAGERGKNLRNWPDTQSCAETTLRMYERILGG